MKATFRAKDAFAAPENSYQLLPFRFMRWDGDTVFLSNDCGESAFISPVDFDGLTTGTLDRDSPTYRELSAKHMLTNGDPTIAIDLLATKYRTKRAHLDGFTGLHLFVVTLRCDHTCPYCQVSRVTEDRSRFDMSAATALRGVDLMFRSPAERLKLEFQGGEPLLNFGLIQTIVQAATERNREERRTLDFVIATNLSQVTDEMLAFCCEHEIHLSTSLDGPEQLHNANRPRRDRDSHQRLVRNLARARKALGHDRVTALMTTTPRSLEHGREIIDEYVRLGFSSIFVRPISPYGFAVRSGLANRYDTERFIDFYKAGLDYIIALNRAGTAFLEVYAQILLRKMLTPFSTGYVDLQSPAGAGIAVAVYNYDGRVYASDEGRMLAEMNDDSFCLGSVKDSYEALFGGSRLRAITAGSCTEVLPGCSECAFSPYCGADPVYNWAVQGDPMGHRPTSGFCHRNMALIRHLFELLRTGDSFTRRLLTAWACQ